VVASEATFRRTLARVDPVALAEVIGAWLADRHRLRARDGPRQRPGRGGWVHPLLANLDLAGAVVTVDALQTHRDAATFLVTGKQAHDLFTVKANQLTLLDRCARLPWHRVPVADCTR
jgi:hypothetical protein